MVFLLVLTITFLWILLRLYQVIPFLFPFILLIHAPQVNIFIVDIVGALYK